MSTQQYAVPIGSPITLVSGDNTDFIAVAAPTGTVTLDVSVDGVNFFGGQTTGTGGCVSLNTKTLNLGAFAKVRVTAAVAAASLFVCDISAPFRGGANAPSGQAIIAQTSLALTSPNSTALVPMFAMRFPAGYFKPNFSLELDLLTLATAAGAKTYTLAFGNTGVATAALALTGIVAGATRASVRLVGRNDGQTVLCSGLGLSNGGGWGANAAAATTISSLASYLTQEQELTIGITKVTGTDTAALDSVLVKLYQ